MKINFFIPMVLFIFAVVKEQLNIKSYGKSMGNDCPFCG